MGEQRVGYTRAVPLLPSDTKQIAIDSGIKHPAIRGVDQVMSTDFWWTAKRSF